jgi:hypothetical protein
MATGHERSDAQRLLRFCDWTGTLRGPYWCTDNCDAPATDESVAETGNGVSRNPSPTEKHNATSVRTIMNKSFIGKSNITDAAQSQKCTQEAQDFIL